MNVLLVKPFMYPQAVQIGCELEDLQKAVGGDIEATYPFNEPVALVIHDEGAYQVKLASASNAIPAHSHEH